MKTKCFNRKVMTNVGNRPIYFKTADYTIASIISHIPQNLFL